MGKNHLLYFQDNMKTIPAMSDLGNW